MREAVQFLVEQGIDVNAANTDGRTALDAAKGVEIRVGRSIPPTEGREEQELSAAVGD
jgi:hypothetical protein